MSLLTPISKTHKVIEMVAKWRTGVDVAYGRRKSRDGESTFKLITASLFYRFFARMMPYPVPVDTGDFKLCDRAVVNAVCALPEKRRYLRNLIPWAGFTHAPVDYDRDARTAGETKYSASRLFSLAAEVLLSSDKIRYICILLPLASVGICGLIIEATFSTKKNLLFQPFLLFSVSYQAQRSYCHRWGICCSLLPRSQARPAFVIREKLVAGNKAG